MYSDSSVQFDKIIIFFLSMKVFPCFNNNQPKNAFALKFVINKWIIGLKYFKFDILGLVLMKLNKARLHITQT